MTAIAFPLGSYPGRNPQESAGRLINAYAEPLGPGAHDGAVIRSTAGLRVFAETDYTGFRGQFYDGLGNLFIAFEDVLARVDEDGEVEEIGELLGTDRVTFARNNATPVPDIVVTTDIAAYAISTTTITEIDDADLPTPNSVTFLDGYFLFGITSGQVFASGLNDITVNALDVTTAEAKPDTLVRVIAYEGMLLVFGEQTIEVFRNVGNPTGFPLSRVTVISRGAVSRNAITGFEEHFAKALVWVGDDDAVHTLSGYSPVRISTPDIDRAIAAVADKSVIEAQCHIADGHAFATISGPEFTWEYNLTTQQWHERKSHLQPRWRTTGNTQYAFGKWLVGDQLSGNILEIAPAERYEAGEPLQSIIESPPMAQFPAGLAVPRADFNFVAGTGILPGLDPTEVDPVVGISWSDNGGQSWSNPLLRKIGRVATNPKVTVLRTGRTGAQGRRWRLTMADAAYLGLLGGDMTVEGRGQ